MYQTLTYTLDSYRHTTIRPVLGFGREATMRLPEVPDRFDEQIDRLAILTDPTRRRLYRYVATQREPVSREQAAAQMGVALHVAKFHLDRLQAHGLLDADYSRPPGRRGPGAGRPAKRYRRSVTEMSVSLPARQYELAGQIMAQAIATAGRTSTSISDALHQAANLAGRQLGELAQTRLGHDNTPTARIRATCAILTDQGYEPCNTNGVITLTACPFHALARDHPDPVCGINLDLITGLLQACPGSGLRAQPGPASGGCCIALAPQDKPR